MKRSLIALIVLSSVCATAALAGGGYTSEPAQVNNENGAYVGAMVGGADRHNFFTAISGDSIPGVNSANWTWALGLNAGYQFDHNLAIEFGGFWLNGARENGYSGYIGNWLGYMGGKIDFPFGDKFSVFTKFGIGLNRVVATGGIQYNLDHYFNDFGHHVNGIGPVFGLGLAYNFNKAFSTSIQYMRFGQSWNQPSGLGYTIGGVKYHSDTAAIDLITVALGYKLSI